MEQVCTALDLTLHLGQKDEYELAHSVLQSLLVWLTQPRLVEQGVNYKDTKPYMSAFL
jgi:hypothetical protein